MIGNLLTHLFLPGTTFLQRESYRHYTFDPSSHYQFRFKWLSNRKGGSHRVVLLLFRLITCLRSTEFLSNVHWTQGLRAFAYHLGEVPTKLVLSMSKRLHCLLVDKPALPRGPTIWLTNTAADFLKGRYSSCTRDIDVRVAKKGEIETTFRNVELRD